MSSELDEAIGRAREHLVRAVVEAVEAARALLEAIAAASGADASATGALLGDLRNALDRLIERLRSEGRLELPAALIAGIERTLAREIERWEALSKRDADARPVLRALLGLRELLWELGIRSPDPKPPETPEPTAPAPPRRPRVQRFDVESS